VVRRVIGAAAVSTVLGTLPVFLLGGLAVLVREDLAFSEAQLGFAATTFFASSALCSYPAGRAAERSGSFATTATGAVLSAAALLGVAVLARSYGVLLACLTLAGGGNALAQLGSNGALAWGVPLERQGFAYGVKQSAIPIATLLAGLAVPAVGLTVGWRWAFAGGAAIALPFVLVAPRTGRPPRATGERVREGDASTLPLVVVAVGAGLAAAATNAFGAFLVESAVADGMAPGTAGLLLAVSSALGIGSRLWLGWSADRREGRHLPVIAGLLATGAAGFALLSAGGTAGLVAGALLTYGSGWSFPGLLNFAIVRVNRRSPAAATGITQTGVFVGGGVGPLAFGLLVERFGYATSWLCAAALMVGAAALMLAGRRLLRADLEIPIAS
jgi:MFS family permease